MTNGRIPLLRKHRVVKTKVQNKRYLDGNCKYGREKFVRIDKEMRLFFANSGTPRCLKGFYIQFLPRHSTERVFIFIVHNVLFFIFYAVVCGYLEKIHSKNGISKI